MSNKAREEKESPFSPITSLPDDVILDILARVPRFYYPGISLVSKSFGKLVASPELYTRRSLIGCTEHSLYVVLQNRVTFEHRLHILCPNLNSNRLVNIRSLPRMPYYARYVAVGSKIYVFYELEAFSIDCRSQTVHPISNVTNPEPMSTDVVDFIDGKVYLIGLCFCDDEVNGKAWRNRVKMYDTETQMWEPNYWSDVVVTKNKIYMKNSEENFVIEQKESKWKLDKLMIPKDWKNTCVVDNVLYFYNIDDNMLRAYDPKPRYWRVVTGLEELLPQMNGSLSSRTVGYGGELAIFFCKHDNARKKENIWCAEIALETLQGGEIRGKVQWCDVVIDDGHFDIIECLAVTV